MVERVKPRRRYDSPRRRAQAAATRGAILDAAQRLFEQRGYTATSMAAIAAEAGVALKTVYLAFDTKSGVLRALWHLLLRGEAAADVPVDDQRWFREALDEREAERQLDLLSRSSRTIKVRAGALMEAMRSAATADPDVGALWERIQADFHRNQRVFVESLAAKHALRAGLDVDAAADILWTLNHPAVYWLLVNERGWTPDRYQEWLAATLRSELLGLPRAPAPPAR